MVGQSHTRRVGFTLGGPILGPSLGIWKPGLEVKTCEGLHESILSPSRTICKSLSILSVMAYEC